MAASTIAPPLRLWLLPSLLGSIALAGCGDEQPEDQLAPGEFRSLDDGLELHWTFEDHVDEQILDLSGNNRHGTLHGGSFVSSPVGEAVSLDGVDDQITFLGPRSPTLYGGVDGDFTISARVRVADVNKFNTLCWGCGPFSVMYVGTASYGERVMAALHDQGSDGVMWPQSSAGLVDDRWREVSLVVEGGQVARWYLDCELDTELEDPDIGLKNFNYSAVGPGSDASRWYQGEIDELRVWSRALSEQELAQLCPEPPPLERGLELHWNFEERSGDEITDVSGNARHGTLQGGAFVSSPAGEAASLDGIDDSIAFVGPRSPSLYGGVDGDFTISARVRVADLAKYNTLCYGCGPFSLWYLGDPSLGGVATSAFHNKTTGGSLWSATSSALVEDQWTEVTTIVEGGVVARHYFDCAFDSQRESADLGLRDYGYSVIGQSPDPSRWYGGEIDELRVWSRALSEQELPLLCRCDGPIHVDADASPGGDGSSWATAFDDLQAALDFASTCAEPQLWVAEGSYAPDPSLPVAAITAPVSIYGGFAGDETSLEQRDVAAHPVQLGDDGWQSRVVVIEPSAVFEFYPVRLDGFTISGSDAGAIEITGALDPQPPTTVFLHNLTITDNTASLGAGILADGGVGVELAGSYFADNSSTRGAAIHLGDGGGSYHLSGNEFVDNSAVWGGAIFLDDDPLDPSTIELEIVDGEFADNVATGGGGALYLEESTTSLESVVFVDNKGGRGGAIEVADGNLAVDPGAVEIVNCRFIANQATVAGGGALSLRELGTTVINTEIVWNEAVGSGGGVWGRGTFTHVTIANNTTGGAGAGLWAPAGPDLMMRHVVVWPDQMKAVGDNIRLGWSCVATNVWYKSMGPGSGGVSISDSNDPLAPADLDNDGRLEYYLDGWPCVDLGGNMTNDGHITDEIDWSSLTTSASQCTDDLPVDPGVHYEPLFDAGVCQ